PRIDEDDPQLTRFHTRSLPAMLADRHARRWVGVLRLSRLSALHCGAMKTDAVVLRTHGGPEVLTRETIDLPEPGPREVRGRVRAVALNHLDLWVRKGLPNLKLEYPHRLGSDFVGEVDALGPGARTDAKVGDRVVVNPGVSCGICEACLTGRDNLCRKY